jgi:hypothetical protein
MVKRLEEAFSPTERDFLNGLDTPVKIQAYLDSIPYSPEDLNRSPLDVIRDRKAHCLDGALFAAACLRRLGYPPLVIDLLPTPGADDDHVLALYQKDGCYGVLAKSNYVCLRSREPVYRSLRELVMSYFDVYFNLWSEKSLRAYTRPLNLATLDVKGWEVSTAGANAVEKRLKELKPIPLITPVQAAVLQPVNQRFYDALSMGANIAGVYKPKVHA